MEDHLGILKQGVDIWNEWRKLDSQIKPNLFRADLKRTDLSKINLSHAELSGADFSNANLSYADFRCANLNGANFNRANLGSSDLRWANLNYASLVNANLSFADLSEANLSRAYLSYANLSYAFLNEAKLVGTDLTEAILNNCQIYGISAWNVQLKGAKQENLVIVDGRQLTITLDNLEVAQFIYLLLNNESVRSVIDTVTSKVVLILGRFTSERKEVLEALRDELRKYNYLPILFDSDKPANRDITETVSTLAHLARFVIADITDAKSIPQELKTIVPNLPSVPIQPLLLSSQREYGMFEHFARFPWVLPIYHYTDQPSLLQSFKENVIDPAEKKAQELAKR